MSNGTSTSRTKPKPTRRTEMLEGIIDSTKRDTLDGLYTLLYYAERTGDTMRSEQLVTAIDAVANPITAITGEDVTF